MSDQELFRIGEVAKMCHMSVGTLRYYEQMGLLQPEYTDPATGYRYYSVRQFEQLPLTLECKYVRTTEEGNIIGEIVNISADERILDEKGGIDIQKLKPISYEPVYHGYYMLGEQVGTAFRDGAKLK